MPYASLAMSMIGWLVFFTISVMAFAPPRSEVQWILSASSSITRRRRPENVLVLDALPATFLITSAVRWSDALSSMLSQPISVASAWAADVFPQPALPYRSAAGCFTLPLSQSIAQAWSVSTALLLPMTSLRVFGRYFSAHSIIIRAQNQWEK